MAKVFNLTHLLASQKSVIEIGDKKYPVTNSFADFLRLDELSSKRDEMSTSEFFREFLSIALGKEAATEILSADYSKDMILAIVSSIQEAISEESIVDGTDSKNP